MGQAFRTYRNQLGSTRFVIAQEGLALGLLAAILKTIWPQFPIIELYGFAGPIVLGVYGIKTYAKVKGKDDEEDLRVLKKALGESEDSLDRDRASLSRLALPGDKVPDHDGSP